MKEHTILRYQFLLDILPGIGEFLKRVHLGQFVIQKKRENDLVTEADLGAEKRLVTAIEKYFPMDGILGEEGSSKESQSGYQWIIDPVDGTTNYSHGLPLYGLSAGLYFIPEKKIHLGAVLFPEMNELYHASLGAGSFKNEKQIRVSSSLTLSDSLLSTGFPYDKSLNYDLLIEYYKNILMKSRGVRRTGAATLDICWVAEGRFDGYWEYGLKPWDSAAASLILTEAGGKLSNFTGGEFDPFEPMIVASNGLIHQEILDFFLENPWKPYP
jgi:myo-inositol-1(or 4)-monophosphatase